MDFQSFRKVVLLMMLGSLTLSMAAHAAPKRRGNAKSAPNGKASSKRTPASATPKIQLPVPEAAPVAENAPPTRGPTRIDFDDRLIQGQSNKSGAVYLYDRKELKVRTMVRRPESFRAEIIDSVYDQ
jgi:hypothetical protein